MQLSKKFIIIRRFFTKKKRKIGKRRKIGQKEYLKNKEQAKLLAEARVAHYNAFYHFKVNKIFIKNTRTRWGSCSRLSNLNFNYKIVLLEPHLVDYIIVHEICHLGEFNHSQNFWDLVAQTIPDYQSRRAALRKIRL